ncbi:hypothetical protein ANCDUO_23274, partial [Ancylostoma duodenale]
VSSMASLPSLASKLSLSLFSSRSICSTPVQCSVFMKRQKKIDPEVAKQREIRRRKRLEKEIRQMQKHSKKPKPVDELTLDVKSAKNIGAVLLIINWISFTTLYADSSFGAYTTLTFGLRWYYAGLVDMTL